MNAFGLPVTVDGLNEMGLHVGLFYFPGFAKYQEIQADDIPKEAARGIEHGKEVADYTLWTIAAGLKNRRYYFRTFENSRIRMVDLKALEFDGQDVRTISIQGEEEIKDVLQRAKWKRPGKQAIKSSGWTCPRP
jgi:penicillin V acylase-like amidase (Ntn superfamily)